MGYPSLELMDEAGIEDLQAAVENMHECEARWLRAIPVHEQFNGQTVWQGEVELFELIGHPKAKRAYAWFHATEGTKRRFYAVLEFGPVKDAVTAVRAAIAADAKRGAP